MYIVFFDFFIIHSFNDLLNVISRYLLFAFVGRVFYDCLEKIFQKILRCGQSFFVLDHSDQIFFFELS